MSADGGEPENRNAEYDAFSAVYATFLLTEILPAVRDRYVISDDPDQWAVCGGSSGGSCAFTVAWMRPDRFRRVLCSLGSFAQIRGGNPYLDVIQETPKRPLRIFLHAATGDLNWGPERNWFSANLRVAAALSERGYDLRLVLGDGGHDPNHGGRSCQTRFAGSGEGNTSEPGGWREAPADRRWLCQRQPEPDVGAAFGAIRGVRLAEVRPCDRLHDRETEAAPFA
jgi:hypothetical protein